MQPNVVGGLSIYYAIAFENNCYAAVRSFALKLAGYFGTEDVVSLETY